MPDCRQDGKARGLLFSQVGAFLKQEAYLPNKTFKTLGTTGAARMVFDFVYEAVAGDGTISA